MKFKIILGKSHKEYVLDSGNSSLNIDDVLLMIADQYSDEWFGCSIQDEKGNFICNAVEEYFRDPIEGYPDKSVYEFAIDRYVHHLKFKNGFYTEVPDYDETRIIVKGNMFEDYTDPGQFVLQSKVR